MAQQCFLCLHSVLEVRFVWLHFIYLQQERVFDVAQHLWDLNLVFLEKMYLGCANELNE